MRHDVRLLLIILYRYDIIIVNGTPREIPSKEGNTENDVIATETFVKNSDDTGDPKVRTAYGVLSGIVGIICNALLCAGKLAVGFFSGSVSVIADAVNNLSDASSSVVTLIGFRLAAKPADEKHPFGHYRIEYFSGLAVAVMIVVIGVELIKVRSRR